jgi:hypothetical protein
VAANAVTILQSGSCERTKAGVHAVLLVTLALCTLYNAAAWWARREPHLAGSAFLYGAGCWWEFGRVRDHLTVKVPGIPPVAVAPVLPVSP